LLPEDVLLEARGLRKYFPVRKGLLQRVIGHVKAVDGVDLRVKRGETLGLVGESGCGKSTTGRALMRLLQPTAGEVRFRSRALAKDSGLGVVVDVAALDRSEAKALRQDMQIIFQDPYSSLDPRMPIGDIVAEPLRVQGVMDRGTRRDRVADLLKAVGLVSEHAKRFPHELSGGQRQRIGIARALALNPSFIVADEPVSALDVSIQAQIINLFEELQTEFNLTYLFIAHDLAVVRHISNRVAVMYLGVIVEVSPSAELYENPLHPYTISLLSAIPIPDPEVERERKPILLAGDLPSPANPPSACRFHTRCPYVQDTLCRDEVPSLRELEPGHLVACHWAEQIKSGTLQPKERVAEIVKPVGPQAAQQLPTG